MTETPPPGPTVLTSSHWQVRSSNLSAQSVCSLLSVRLVTIVSSLVPQLSSPLHKPTQIVESVARFYHDADRRRYMSAAPSNEHTCSQSMLGGKFECQGVRRSTRKCITFRDLNVSPTNKSLSVSLQSQPPHLHRPTFTVSCRASMQHRRIRLPLSRVLHRLA